MDKTSVHLAVLALTMRLWVGHPATAELENVQELLKRSVATRERTRCPQKNSSTALIGLLIV